MNGGHWANQYMLLGTDLDEALSDTTCDVEDPSDHGILTFDACQRTWLQVEDTERLRQEYIEEKAERVKNAERVRLRAEFCASWVRPPRRYVRQRAS